MTPVIIRVAAAADAEAVRDIYAPYVQGTAITFDYETPTLGDVEAMIGRTLERFPFLVAEDGDGVAAYAYVAPFKDRAAYDRSVELSVYCARRARGVGIGSALYDAMERILGVQGILNVNACIAAAPEDRLDDEYLTEASVRFHERRGYSLVGRFHSCGFKFGRWYDMVWMEKMLGAHEADPRPVVPFSSVDAAALLR